jgi:uridine kinase
MIIGIGGCSNSGKSTLAELIIEQYANQKSIILCQDDYTLEEEQIPNHYEHTDWEIPESIDIERYLNDVIEAKDNYDLVICEGLFPFWFDELSQLFDRNIYLNLDKDEFLLRKAKDDRWGNDPEWYIRHIWDNHQVYGKIKHPHEEDIIVDSNPGVFDIETILKQLSAVNT